MRIDLRQMELPLLDSEEKLGLRVTGGIKGQNDQLADLCSLLISLIECLVLNHGDYFLLYIVTGPKKQGTSMK